MKYLPFIFLPNINLLNITWVLLWLVNACLYILSKTKHNLSWYAASNNQIAKKKRCNPFVLRFSKSISPKCFFPYFNTSKKCYEHLLEVFKIMGTLIWNRLKLRNSLQPLIGPIKQLNDRDKIWNKKNISSCLK